MQSTFQLTLRNILRSIITFLVNHFFFLFTSNKHKKIFKFQWKKKLIRRIIKGIFRRQNKKTSLSYNFTNYIVVQTECAITKQLPTHQAYHRSIKEISSVEAIILRTCIPKIEEKIDCKSDYFHENFFPWFHSKWSKWFFLKARILMIFICFDKIVFQ